MASGLLVEAAVGQCVGDAGEQRLVGRLAAPEGVNANFLGGEVDLGSD